MNAKSSAHYQREFRRRMREKGLVKKEVWIRPEQAAVLLEIEKRLRESTTFNTKSEDHYMQESNLSLWDTKKLYAALEDSELVRSEQATLDYIEGIEATILINMTEYGDLPVFLTVSGNQIIAETILWALSEINDLAAFNECILRTHKYFPLSTISIDKGPDSKEYYYMFGALAATSALPEVTNEITTLATNVIQVAGAYKQFLQID